MDRSDIKVRGSHLLVCNKVYVQFQSRAVVKVEQVVSSDQTGSEPAEVDVTPSNYLEVGPSELADPLTSPFLIPAHP